MTDSRPQANQNNGVYAGGDGLVWHPAIRALGWVKDWIVWATFVAVLWEFASIGLDPVTRVISFGSVVIRLGVVCAALVGLVIPIYLFHTWLWAVQLIRKNHPVLWFSAMVITTVTAIVLVIGGMYGWMIHGCFIGYGLFSTNLRTAASDMSSRISRSGYRLPFSQRRSLLRSCC